MVMAIQSQFFVFIAITLAGFAGLGWFLYDTRKSVKKILGGSASADTDIQTGIIRKIARMDAMREEAEPRIREMEKISAMSIHKVGFLRFNPFQDTGGNNSFVLVLLDREDTGVVLSSLYMREGARLYGKEINRGVAHTPLSAEEKKVLEETKRK